MKAALLMTFAFCAFSVACSRKQEPRPFPNSQSVKRLDGSTINAAEIDSTVEQAMRAGKVTGVGLAILNSGGIVYLKGYGQRNVSGNLPLTRDSIMSAASFTKVVFADNPPDRFPEPGQPECPFDKTGQKC